jgi:hypothetical protein
VRRAVAALLGGSLLLAAAAGVWWDGQDRGFGADRVTALTVPDRVTARTAPDRASPAEPAGPTGVEARSARLDDLALPLPDAPVELSVAGRSAPVVPVGVEPSGLVEVPADVGTVGWYRHGVAPGDDAGSAVLVGHVDAARQGLGVLAELRDLPDGAAVEVRRAGGDVLRYRVVAREQWDKGEVPMERLFEPGGPPRLVLISCAGQFDPVTRTYSDNVAVTAVPA